MKVRELIAVLKNFNPDGEVHLCVGWPDRVAETHEKIWVGNYGSGPQINAAMGFAGSCVYVGCALGQRMARPPKQTINLGHYDNEEDAAKVRDFYVVHQGLDEPLNFPDFDYQKWIPPRTSSGEYNEHIANILRNKLLGD